MLGGASEAPPNFSGFGAARDLALRGPDQHGVEEFSAVVEGPTAVQVNVGDQPYFAVVAGHGDGLPAPVGVYEIRAGCDGSLQLRCIPSQASGPAVRRGEP